MCKRSRQRLRNRFICLIGQIISVNTRPFWVGTRPMILKQTTLIPLRVKLSLRLLLQRFHPEPVYISETTVIDLRGAGGKKPHFRTDPQTRFGLKGRPCISI